MIRKNKFNPELSQSKEILKRYKVIDKVIDENHLLNPVTLENKFELDCLCELFSLRLVGIFEQPSSDFKQVYLLIQRKCFDEDEFGDLYSAWIKATERESNMDEYGQLIFLTNDGFYYKPFKCLLEEWII